MTKKERHEIAQVAHEIAHMSYNLNIVDAHTPKFMKTHSRRSMEELKRTFKRLAPFIEQYLMGDIGGF